MEMSPTTRSASAPAPTLKAQRSAVTNGKRLHVVSPGDTAWSRRFRDMLSEIISDLGHDGLSEGQRQVARRAADIAAPSNVEVGDAITLILNMRGVATNGFLCDAAPTTRRREMNRHLLRHLTPEDQNILEDGETRRVPVSLMDSAKPRMKIGDGSKNFAGHRPRWRIGAASLTDEKRAERQKLYSTYDAAVENACTGFGSAPSTEVRGDKPGDPCTCRGPQYPWDVGSPGHLDRNRCTA
jgi:hypothetical protein